jgi:hypothetical protein
MAPTKTAPIFISYAHGDNESPDPAKRWLDRLREQLEPLVRQGQIVVSSDQDIQLGDNWHADIQQQLSGAHAAILLVSPAFLASQYIRNSELPVLLRNAQFQGLKIIPIILRPCLFMESSFKYPDPQTGPQEVSLASLQAAGSPRKALSEMNEGEQDRVLLGVARAVAGLANRRVGSSDPQRDQSLSATAVESERTDPSSTISHDPAAPTVEAEPDVDQTSRRHGAGGVRPVVQEDASALELWQKKLAFLRAEEARVSDAEQKFSIQQRIVEAGKKVRDLGGLS